MRPTLQEIDQIRQEGFRPQAVGCILHNKKLLFVYKEKYNLWQLPQGGIDNGETVKQAISREMTEELGENFGKKIKIISIIGEDKLSFSKHIQNLRSLKTDAGKDIFMLGKKYFFVVTKTQTPNLKISQTEFDDHRWLTYEQTLPIIKTIKQKQKQEMTAKIINLLHANHFL